MTPLTALAARVELLERRHKALEAADAEILSELREMRADMARQLKTYCDELLSVHKAVLKTWKKNAARKAARSDP
jgi:K+-sensing histidine kinase KdpD